MRSKRTLILCLCIALAASLAIGGTLAYLTDKEEVVNTFTLGNVDIEVVEKFEPDSVLNPSVAVEKQVSIKNIGSNDAWVWFTYAVPADLDQALLVQLGSEADWIYSDDPVAEDVEIDGKLYNVYAVKYNKILPVGDETSPVGDETSPGMLSVMLDSMMDFQDGKYVLVVDGEPMDLTDAITFDENGQIKMDVIVTGYAIQAAGLDGEGATVEEAYEAYNRQWNPDDEEPIVPEGPEAQVATSLEDLTRILTEASDEPVEIKLGASIAFGSSTLEIPANAVVTLDLGDYTLEGTSSSGVIVVGEGAKLTIKGGENGAVAGNRRGIALNGNAEVNVESGSFSISNKTLTRSVFYFMGENAKVNISGGNFDAYRTSSTVSSYFSYTGSATVNASITGGTFNNKPENSYVAEGYTAVLQGSVYVVVKAD